MTDSLTLPRVEQRARWLLLVHQLPAKPAYVRVKLWRRLHALGAVGLKNAVHALPMSAQSQEDFQWLMKEIISDGGDAVICEAQLVDGLSDSDIRELFNSARDAAYAEIAEEARAITEKLDGDATAETRSDVKAQLLRLKSRYRETVAIDFFDANGRQPTDGLIRALEARLSEPTGEVPGAQHTPTPRIEDLKGRVWVTRQGVHVDRIACAWLVRRFIDQDASVKFVAPQGYRPEPNDVRFDMFEAEITHEGDRCSFEVLLARAGLEDSALRAIAEIVHDIDLKDEKYAREEAPGIKALINGLCRSTRDDEERLARGFAIFDDLYAVFRIRRGMRKP
jgi:hypothetical protein